MAYPVSKFTIHYAQHVCSQRLCRRHRSEMMVISCMNVILISYIQQSHQLHKHSPSMLSELLIKIIISAIIRLDFQHQIIQNGIWQFMQSKSIYCSVGLFVILIFCFFFLCIKISLFTYLFISKLPTTCSMFEFLHTIPA